MAPPRLRPRAEQVDALTTGQMLPLSAVRAVHLGIIAEAVMSAWGTLRTTYGAQLSTWDEAEINALLEANLNRQAHQRGLFGQVVSIVARGKETINYDGRHLEKRPDLSFFLTGGNPSFPLVAECKILDAAASKTVDMYCNNGLHRFVVGDYAWANRDGLMLGYVRDGASIAASLLPFLERQYASDSDPYSTEALPDQPSVATPLLTMSRHGRHFSYMGHLSGTPPGAISVWHMWLN